jgi:hypothetical protein
MVVVDAGDEFRILADAVEVQTSDLDHEISPEQAEGA